VRETKKGEYTFPSPEPFIQNIKRNIP